MAWKQLEPDPQQQPVRAPTGSMRDRERTRAKHRVMDFTSTASVAAAKEASDADAFDSRKCCMSGSGAEILNKKEHISWSLQAKKHLLLCRQIFSEALERAITYTA